MKFVSSTQVRLVLFPRHEVYSLDAKASLNAWLISDLCNVTPCLAEYHNLYELFHARASMHRTVYTHP